TDSFCREFNSVFSVMKTEKMWLAKLNDSRMLISDQLLAVADAISAEKERCISSIDTVLEDNIRSQMDKACIYPKELVAERDSYGDFCISVKFKEIKLRSDTLFAISQIIFDITGKKTNCTSPIRNGEEVSYRFYPARRLTASIGYAAEAKNGERVNGDSFSFFSADGQNLHIILSDGMGSGEKAKEQSRLATELLEKFLRAGFKSDTAVSLINSSLLLRSSKDIFSTVDLCSLNLCSAEALFIKLGAASSYIKTEGKISSITGTSLPAGILRDIEVEKHFLSVTDNSVILLMSDGIADIALKNPSLEGWIERELENIDTTNSQIIATKIMDKASRLLKNSIHDDMTVIAVSVKKV
ncbi:MAG: SpoIIE family protein phosphatase, partial [Clostridia bacterium]|nr:SpoIIE family protein phosphatase [Clostridia bacterium]